MATDATGGDMTPTGGDTEDDASAAATSHDEAASPPIDAAVPPGSVARFRSAKGPSAPFWIAFLLGILAVIVFALSASALFVFAIGVALAFFLVPVVNWLERRGWKRWVAAIVAVATTLLGALLGLALVIIVVVTQGVRLVEELPSILDQMGADYRAAVLPDWLRAGLDTIIASVQDNLAGLDQGAVVAGLIGSTLSLVGGFFAWMLLPFFLFYLLTDQPTMSQNFYARVPAPWKDNVSTVLTILVGNVAQYFRAEFVVGSIVFLMVTLGMLAIGYATGASLLMEFAILLGVIAFVMELVPQIGPILSYIPALLVAIPGGIPAIILVSVYYFVVFNIEGSILVPKLEGRMISFSGASVLVLIALGFALGGIIGAILALPLASIVRDVFRHFFDQAVQESLVFEPAPATAGSDQRTST